METEPGQNFNPYTCVCVCVCVCVCTVGYAITNDATMNMNSFHQ